jgi:F0F1-type ATP synthase assembly protein I
MANPNIAALTSIYGNTAYIIPSTTAVSVAWTYNGSTALTGLTPAAGTVNKITSIVATNVTANAASISIGVSNNSTYASGTPYYLAYQISVPSNST